MSVEQTAYRRAVATLRRTGVVDGIWTAAASAGSKAQTLTVLAVAGAAQGVDGVGRVVLATSTAVLATAVVDLGFSTQIMRVYAAGGLVSRRTVLAPLAWRAGVLVPFALVAAAVVVAPAVVEGRAWSVSVAVYALGYLASSVVTRLAYGVGRFRGGATLNGAVRAATVPALLLAQHVGAPLWTALVVLALGELVIAAVQYGLVPVALGEDRETGVLRVRHTWRFGLAPLVNTVMNRSDAVLVSFFAATAAVGVYGLASQVEGALTTVALVPAGAAVAYAARSRSHADVASQRRVVAGVVAAAYVVLAVPVLLAPEAIVELVFSVTLQDADALRICVVAGIFSCLGGVATQQITGLGRQHALVAVWLSTLVVGVLGLALGAATAGAVGAAWGALARDVVFFLLSWSLLVSPGARSRRREAA